MSKQLNIGLFGFGCVGQGLYEVLSNSVKFKADFQKICIKHPEKKRILDQQLFTTNKWDILNDPTINTVIELIDDPQDAYIIVTEALKRNKNVVTANKKLVAEHLEELLELQRKHHVSLIHEAAVCGGIPIIRTLEEYYDNERLTSITGIFNGSSNYILTKVFKENQSYQGALEQAQKLGFAETDPTLDVGGFDPKYKLVILALHAFGIILKPKDVLNCGIQNISSIEKNVYDDSSLQIKLTPSIQRLPNGHIQAFVLPQLIGTTHPLYNINNEYNAVIVEGIFSNEQLFIGKGAGAHPTGSAVLSDISALCYDYKYEYKKYYHHQNISLDNSAKIKLYFSGEKQNLEKIFGEDRAIEVENGGVVLAEESIQWVIDHQKQIEALSLFVAQIHNEALVPLQKWLKKYELVYALT